MAETTSYDNMFYGTVSTVDEQGTVLSGNNLARGTVLGRITASGKYVAVDSTAVDGSQNPYGILADDTDASSADAVGGIYLKGYFNENQLVFGGTDTIADHKTALRDLGIYTKAATAAL